MTKNTQTITSLPVGYTLQGTDTTWPYVWTYVVRGPDKGRTQKYGMDFLVEEEWLTQSEDGTVSWVESKEGEEPREFNPIPDSQFPSGGMTEEHNVFNSETGKWEYPNVHNELHNRHERVSDNDVPNALDALCDVEAMEAVSMAFNVITPSEHRATVRPMRHIITKCLNDKAKHSAKYGIEHAWIIALDVVKAPAMHYRNQEYIQEAQSFADDFLAHLNSKSATQLGGPYFKYILKMCELMKADRGKKTGRFAPRRAKIVETVGANPTGADVTAESLFLKLKAIVVPAPSSP